MTKNVDSDNFEILALIMCVNLICGRDLSAYRRLGNTRERKFSFDPAGAFFTKNAVRFAKVGNIHFALGRLGARKTSVGLRGR